MLPPNIDIPTDDAAMEGQLKNDKDGEPFIQRVRRYSKTPRDAEPKATTMKYYSPG